MSIEIPLQVIYDPDDKEQDKYIEFLREDNDDLPDLLCLTCGNIVGYDNYCPCMEE